MSNTGAAGEAPTLQGQVRLPFFRYGQCGGARGQRRGRSGRTPDAVGLQGRAASRSGGRASAPPSDSVRHPAPTGRKERPSGTLKPYLPAQERTGENAAARGRFHGVEPSHAGEMISMPSWRSCRACVAHKVTDHRVTGLTHSARPNNDSNDRRSHPVVVEVTLVLARHGTHPTDAVVGSSHRRSRVLGNDEPVDGERFWRVTVDVTSSGRSTTLRSASRRASRSRASRTRRRSGSSPTACSSSSGSGAAAETAIGS